MRQSPARRCDLVLFDCDGVLVDSEPIANRVLAELLGEIGLPMSYDETVRTFIGHSMRVCLDLIAERLGRPAPADFAERYHARAEAAFRRELRPVPGVDAVLDFVERGLAVPFCVASSSDHTTLRTTLGVTGLLPRVEGRLFSATEVPRGKPHPDLFLHAARAMGAEPARCAVVEDTPVGARAGTAAGMAVFGFARVTDAAALAAEGATVFRHMWELPPLLGRG